VKILTLFLVIAATSISRADFQIGSGLSSSTSGRVVPALALGWDETNWSISAISTGARTSLYVHNSYTLSGYHKWNLTKGPHVSLDAGFGAGVFYALRRYRPSVGQATDQADDFNAGPAFRISASAWNTFFFAIESMYGLKKPIPLIALSPQDTAHFSVGVQF